MRRIKLITFVVCIALACTFALSACSSTAAQGGESGQAMGSLRTETTERMVDVLASLNAAYVGCDEGDNCVVYGFGRYNGRTLAILIDFEDGEYHSWVGSYSIEGTTYTITDDITGEQAVYTASQDAGGTLLLRKEGITGTASLVSSFGTSGIEANLALYDDSLLDYEISLLI